MFCISLALKNANTPPVVLLYEKQETFDTAVANIKTPNAAQFNGTMLELSDDYGGAYYGERASVAAYWFEDMNQVQLGTVERNLHQARTQMKFQTRVEGDAALRAGISRGRPLIEPMGAFPGGANGRG